MTLRAPLTLSILSLLLTIACASGHGSITRDSDPDSGPESSGGQGGQALPDTIPIPPDAEGWVDRDSNLLGLQGSWHDDAGIDSVIDYTISEAGICATGTTAQVVDGQWSDYWGASIGFSVCESAADDDPPDTLYTLGTCPWAEGVSNLIEGIRFQISGTAPNQLWVIFRERDRQYSTFVAVQPEGEVVALFQDATSWDSGAPPLDPAQIEAIDFQFLASTSETLSFDFCITSLEALTGGDWNSSEVPEWAYETGPGMLLEYAGVNVCGAEFGEDSLPGIFGTDYTYPTDREVDWVVRTGMNVIRLPFLWERLQETLGGELDAEQLGLIDEFVTYATGAGVSVIIDPHNFARYAGQVVGVDFPESMLADFWGRVAAHYHDNDRIIFGLMNEPHDIPEIPAATADGVPTDGTEIWLAAANASIEAIRAAGATQLILVPGTAWTGAHNWNADYYGKPNGEVMPGVVDPGDNFAFEVHQYLDSNSSGGSMTCVSETIGSERLTDFTEWARANGYRAFLGEFGSAPNETCLLAVDDMLTYMGENNDVWMGWAWWAAGPWWGSYQLSIQPDTNGRDQTQTYVLARHLPGGQLAAQ